MYFFKNCSFHLFTNTAVIPLAFMSIKILSISKKYDFPQILPSLTVLLIFNKIYSNKNIFCFISRRVNLIFLYLIKILITE